MKINDIQVKINDIPTRITFNLPVIALWAKALMLSEADG